MIIWSGWGILTLLILGGVPILGIGILDQVLHLSPERGELPWTVIVTLTLAAALNWWLGKRLNSDPGRELVDAATGQRIILRRRHALFWIPMQYWSVLPLLLAVLLTAASLFGGPEAPVMKDSGAGLATPTSARN